MVISYRCNLFSCFIHTVHLTPSTTPQPHFFTLSLIKQSSVAGPGLLVADLGKALDFSSPTYAEGPTAFLRAFLWKM